MLNVAGLWIGENSRVNEVNRVNGVNDEVENEVEGEREVENERFVRDCESPVHTVNHDHDRQENRQGRKREVKKHTCGVICNALVADSGFFSFLVAFLRGESKNRCGDSFLVSK